MLTFIDKMDQQTINFENNDELNAFKGDYTFNIGIKQNLLDYTDTRNKYQIESRENDMHQVISYLKVVAKDFERIELDDLRLSGMPVIKNTRIPVTLVISCIKDGMTIEEIADDYNISHADIADALEFTVQLLTRPYMDEDD